MTDYLFKPMNLLTKIFSGEILKLQDNLFQDLHSEKVKPWQKQIVWHGDYKYGKSKNLNVQLIGDRTPINKLTKARAKFFLNELDTNVFPIITKKAIHAIGKRVENFKLATLYTRHEKQNEIGLIFFRKRKRKTLH